MEVAADVGISHPAILHHFGTREGLLRDLLTRAIEQMQRDLGAALATLRFDEGKPVDLSPFLDRVLETLSRRGHARLIAWMVLSGRWPRGVAKHQPVRDLAVAIHQVRHSELSRRSHKPPPFEDTLYTILWIGMALFGEAIIGPETRVRAGVGADPKMRHEYRRWLAHRVLMLLAIDDQDRLVGVPQG